MRLNSENTEGKMIRDQRSMAFTSVRSGILIFNCEDRLRRRLRFIWAERSSEWRLAERGPIPPLCLRYWMCVEAVLSNCTMDWEFLMSATLVVISPPATSLWISKVVSRMFPWPCGSAWMEKEKEKNYVYDHIRGADLGTFPPCSTFISRPRNAEVTEGFLLPEP